MFGKTKTPEQPENDSKESVFELQMRVRALERVVRQFDHDLNDAIDGFYRRRQSDRMREVRADEEAIQKKKKPSERDILMRALELSGNKGNEE